MEASHDDGGSEYSSINSTWNSFQEELLKGISERSNCMRWLHNQCQLHFESMNFWLTIPNVIISTLNGSFTMSLNALFPDPGTQTIATTIIGLVSILSAVLITMNQYVKSQQMMEAHRSAALAYGKLHRIIGNELAMRRDQRQNALEFLKLVRTEQDRLENSSPSVLPSVIIKFNRQFADRDIEKPEIAGDFDETAVNSASKHRKKADSPASMLFPPTLFGKHVSKPLQAKQRSSASILPRPERTEDSIPENVVIDGGSPTVKGPLQR
jgi:hypothetical protein